jgi:inorganic triphosphatase YgiF
MSETDATAMAGGNTRANAGPASDPAAQDAKKNENVVAFTRRDRVEPSPEGPAHTDTKESHEGAPRGEAVEADVSSPSAALPPNVEIELKLLVDRDRLSDFNDAPVIAANARSKGSRKHLKSVYYDTSERTLWRNGLTLRVRKSGTRFVQTVKAEASDHPLRRGEWEANVASFAPDIALAMPFIPIKLRADLEAQGLEAVFTSDIHRHVRIVDLPSGTVEVAFDKGFLKSGDRSAPVGEIELELKGGSASAIYELALRLAEHGQVQPSIRAKSARGFELAADIPPVARKPRKLRLDPQVSLDDAFATILRACLSHLLESIPAAEDGRDPEGIHQLRVALRRIRSAFDLMRSVGHLSKLDMLRSEARWLAQSLSAARDWDIFQKKTLPTVAKSCPAIAGFDLLEAVAEKHQSAAYRKARLVLAERRCANFVLLLGSWIEARGWRSDVAAEGLAQLAEPTSNFAARMLSLQQAKVLKRGRRFKSLSAEERHRVRLAVKKLRYVADFLLPLYGDRKPVRRYSDRLTDLQKDLGSYNDMATTTSLLAGLGAEAPGSSNAAAAITGWQAHAMVGVEPHLRNAWSDFVKAKVPWLREAEE